MTLSILKKFVTIMSHVIISSKTGCSRNLLEKCLQLLVIITSYATGAQTT